MGCRGKEWSSIRKKLAKLFVPLEWDRYRQVFLHIQFQFAFTIRGHKSGGKHWREKVIELILRQYVKSEVHVSSNIGLGGKRYVRESCYAALGSRIKGIPSPGNLLDIYNLRCFCRSWVRIWSFVCTLKFENPWFRKWEDTANYPYCNYNRPFTFNTLFSFLSTDGKYNSGGLFPCWVATE